MQKSILIRFLVLSLCLIITAPLGADSRRQSTEEAFLTCYAESLPAEEAYKELALLQPERAQVLKQQADSVAFIFHEVMKTEKQLVPKQCNYLIVYGYENSSAADIQKGCDNMRLALFANADRPSMQLFLAGNPKHIALFKAAALKTPVNPASITEIECTTLKEAARTIIPLIIADVAGKGYDMENLLYRRILLLTKATNSRIGYAACTAALGANIHTMIFDCFSSLDIDRKSLDTPSKAERRAAFMELLNPLE
ncbi:MAG: hypothetical protein P1P65_00030 [Treponema sp.]